MIRDIDAQGAVIVETLEDWGTFDSRSVPGQGRASDIPNWSLLLPSAWLTTPACAEVMEKDASLW